MELDGTDGVINLDGKAERKNGKHFLVIIWTRGNRKVRPDLRNYRRCWIEAEIKQFLASVHHLLPSLAAAPQTSAPEFSKQSGDHV